MKVGKLWLALATLAALGAATAARADIALYNVAERMLAPYAAYRRAFGRDLEPVHATDDQLVIGVNTTRPWRHTRGEVSAAQIERVAALLGSQLAGSSAAVTPRRPT